MDYKEMYLTLFNRITDALRQMENAHFDLAADTLKKAQQETEEQYISALI